MQISTRIASTLVIGTALALSACETIPKGSDLANEARQALATQPVCCADLRQAQVVPLPLDGKLFAFGPKAKSDKPASSSKGVLTVPLQARQFGDQKSYFVVFALPAYEQPYRIVISSEQSGGGDQETALMLPHVQLLTADFQPTRSFDVNDLRTRGSSVERTVFINAENANERHLLIHAAQLNAPITRSVSVVSTNSTQVRPGVTMYSNSGFDSKLKVHPSPTGQLRLDVVGLPNKDSKAKR